jgi:hypothetical protein
MSHVGKTVRTIIVEEGGGGGGGGGITVTARTTDGNLHLIAALLIPVGTVCRFVLELVAKQISGGSGYANFATRKWGARNTGPGAELLPGINNVPIVADDPDDKSNPNFDLFVDVSGTDVVIYVQGDDGIVVDWAANIIEIFVG